MNRLTVTLILIAWVVVQTLAHGINTNTIIALFLALPLIAFCFYLIWFDSKKPYDQQWRYANRKNGQRKNL